MKCNLYKYLYLSAKTFSKFRLIYHDGKKSLQKKTNFVYFLMMREKERGQQVLLIAI